MTRRVYDSDGLTYVPHQGRRRHYLPLANFHRLDMAGAEVGDAFDTFPLLVGSCLVRRDWRDVDVRVVVSDAVFAALFNGGIGALLNLSVSCMMSDLSGLPVDFQIQKQSDSDSEKGRRLGLGGRYIK